MVHVPSHPRSDARLAALARSAAKARSSRPTKPITARSRTSAVRRKTTRAVPSPRAARAAPPTSARSLPWSSAAATSARSMFRLPIRQRSRRSSRENIARESRLHTDESRLYFNAADTFAAHETVHHTSGEYVRYEDGRAIHTNSAEGYFSIFKRGMRGVYQHCKEKHLAPLSRRVRSPLQSPRRARLQRHRPHPRCDPWR